MEEKVLHSESVEGPMTMEVRVVSKVEGESESRVYDFQGKGILGIIVGDGDHDGQTRAQGFVIGLSTPSLLKGLETAIRMTQKHLTEDGLDSLGILALSTMLMSMSEDMIDSALRHHDNN